MRVLFLSLVVSSILPTNMSMKNSSTCPESFRRLKSKVSFYGTHIQFLALVYRSTELSENPRFFNNHSWERAGEPIQENHNSQNHPTTCYVVTETALSYSREPSPKNIPQIGYKTWLHRRLWQENLQDYLHISHQDYLFHFLWEKIFAKILPKIVQSLEFGESWTKLGELCPN